MIIQSISMTNWKCFENRTVTFDRLTILNWKNGEGKTSLIQAIVLCLFDKRPDNLNFDNLVDVTKPTKLTLHFTHNASTYVVEREVGKTSAYRVFKDENLIAKNNKECKDILNKIINESVLTSLWGYESLSTSKVLSSAYVMEILEQEFNESNLLNKYFNAERTYNQKRKATLEKDITNQTITQAEVDDLKDELNNIENEIKDKTLISDDEVVRAKQAKLDFQKYQDLLKDLGQTIYDRETCLRLIKYGKTLEERNAYFDNIRKELELEKNKGELSPLATYSKSTIESLIKESEKTCTCILCGGKDFKAPHINYDSVDNAKIQSLEKILTDEQYDFNDLMTSIKYWHIKKEIDKVEYSKDIDFNTILNNYNANTNTLFAKRDTLKAQLKDLDKDLAQINELLEARKNYDIDKTCLNIIDEYIAEAKTYFAQEIVKKATNYLKNINSRYLEIFIDNGIYKVHLFDKDFIEEMILPAQVLSKGEKTIVALSLILAIREIFMPNLPLIMDESFVNLDAENLNGIKDIINTDKNQWIIVSHDERLIN